MPPPLRIVVGGLAEPVSSPSPQSTCLASALRLGPRVVLAEQWAGGQGEL